MAASSSDVHAGDDPGDRATPLSGTQLSQAAMAIYQHATLDRDKSLADAIGDTYLRWVESKHP